MTDRLAVVAIGHAIVDVLAPVEDALLDRLGVVKGAMQLIEGPRAAEIYAAMPPAREISGGAAANTVAGLASFGHPAGFIGKVRDDQLGRIFAHDLRAQGVVYDGPVAPGGGTPETARSLILVSPDGQRSMNTDLGIAGRVEPADIDERLVARADWLYLEGYLFDNAPAVEAMDRAIGAIRRAGGRVALTLSDAFCVDRHRAHYERLLGGAVDLVFANRAEALALARTEDLDAALAHLAGLVPIAAVTLSEEGAVVVRGSRRTRVAAEPVEVVDTTGAGDLFAAGFFAGLARGADDRGAAALGCLAAAEVIGHLGARPEVSLADLAAARGF